MAKLSSRLGSSNQSSRGHSHAATAAGHHSRKMSRVLASAYVVRAASAHSGGAGVIEEMHYATQSAMGGSSTTSPGGAQWYS